jgi:hypothetical protein
MRPDKAPSRHASAVSNPSVSPETAPARNALERTRPLTVSPARSRSAWASRSRSAPRTSSPESAQARFATRTGPTKRGCSPRIVTSPKAVARPVVQVPSARRGATTASVPAKPSRSAPAPSALNATRPWSASISPRPSTIDRRQSGRRNGVLLAGRA